MQTAYQHDAVREIHFARRRSVDTALHEAYLSIVAVDPAAQGQGLGRKLLEPTIAEADRLSATCYLETFSLRNLSFYERLGFSTEARFAEPTTGADYAVMVRYPNAPAASGAR
jgi:GNAT superfamily N-acetyltransferase